NVRTNGDHFGARYGRCGSPRGTKTAATRDGMSNVDQEDGAPPTIPAALARAAARFGGDEALVTAGVRWTFAELADRVERAAGCLLARGVEPGDRVAIWAPNSPEWAVASLAIHSIGAVLVPLNTRFKGAEARY